MGGTDNTSLVERLRKEQYGIEDGCSQPDYRRGWNAAMERAIALLSTSGDREVAGYVFRPDETPVTVEIEESEEGES